MADLYRVVDNNGKAYDISATPESAVRSALVDLGHDGIDLDTDTARRLWASLKRNGWSLRRVKPL